MKDLKLHKNKNINFINELYQSNKPLIIYKVIDGYNIYTDFSKKFILNKKNINKFLNSDVKKSKEKSEINSNEIVSFFTILNL